MNGYYVVLITTPVDKGEEIANFIIENKLGACVNVVKEVRSIYWWKGNIEKDTEALLVVKTSAEKFNQLIREVKKIHPYTVPEIIALPIVAGNPEYLNWIDDSLA
ncbi:MAG TPA: divalent-cation tolerance protein CutA [Aquificaceae bacterium]|nr:divalent-cation tolerance protein CutA [Aquificaceae bacterium]HIQ48219.1 divalent-cation tolerance protein CutA [Aquifex aeolicus]